MSLSEHLDDIMSDTLPLGDVSLEALAIKQVTMDMNDGSSKTRTVVKFSKNFSRKLNVLYDTIHLKSVISKQEVVSRDMAMEAMAGMDDLITIKAKLTNAASRQNKAIVVSELEPTTDVLPEEYIDRLTEFNNLNSETKETRDNLTKSLSSLLENFSVEMKRLSKNPPIVIYNGASINLYTSSVYTVMGINDSELMYEKYDSKLIKQFREFSTDYSPVTVTQLTPVSIDPNFSVEAETDIDLDVTEEEEEISSKLIDKINEDTPTKVSAENNREVAVLETDPNENSLESITQRTSTNISILLNCLNEVSVFEDKVSKLVYVLNLNNEAKVSNLLTVETYDVINSLPEFHGLLQRLLEANDCLAKQDNPVELLLKLLVFLD